MSDWSHDVTHRPPATFAPAGTYRKSADEIYLIMRDPKNSPNGLASAIQMNVFFVNRAGKRGDPAMIERIKTATRMLQLELRVLRKKATKPERDAFENTKKRLSLGRRRKPVFPPPPKEKMIGGRNGMESVERWQGAK